MVGAVVVAVGVRRLGDLELKLVELSLALGALALIERPLGLGDLLDVVLIAHVEPCRLLGALVELVENHAHLHLRDGAIFESLDPREALLGHLK